MGINLLFSGMGPTTEDQIKVREPLTHALFKWLQAIDAWTYSTYPGDTTDDEEADYRSKLADKAR